MMRMKAVVLLLGLLAAGKIATQDYLYRSGTREVLISTYRDRAISACQKDPRNQGLVANVNAWSRPGDIKVVIGKGDLDVWFWQIDNALWNARYRNPYLLLATGDRMSNVSCEYDIVHGIASVSRG
jgi:hypothetical protein